jgi:hypothetical protein
MCHAIWLQTVTSPVHAWKELGNKDTGRGVTKTQMINGRKGREKNEVNQDEVKDEGIFIFIYDSFNDAFTSSHDTCRVKW